MRGKLNKSCVNFRRQRITPAGAGKTFALCFPFGLLRDHPRRCGENCFERCRNGNLSGSPPQVRGKPLNCISLFGTTGITPAGAGKTPFAQCYYTTHQDHPRRCGENTADKILKLHASGSPPQVRGKLIRIPMLTYAKRITPAGAGKTIAHTDFSRCTQDHPRRCGENGFPQCAWVSDSGSPPQVRGKLFALARTTQPLGITPAGAGKTGY